METREAQTKRLVDTGQYLLSLRKEKGDNIADVCAALSISKSYYSEIENGKKLPSDKLIMELSDYFHISETELFGRFGKVPLAAREVVTENLDLQDTLNKMGKDKKIAKLSEDERQRLFDNMFKMYSDFVKGID